MIVDGEEYNEKIIPEAKFRKQLLEKAKIYGCDIEIKAIIEKYDRILKRCTNDKEKKDIAIMAVAEVHKTMNCFGALVVNGREVLPAKEG